MLLGEKAFIDEARVIRKMLGGGMRQAGVLAAAGLIALEESPKGLPEDHANAKRLAEGLAELPGVTIDPKREDHEYGKFAWIMDPEGNRIELWEPPK